MLANYRTATLLLISSVLILGACTLPTAYTPSPVAQATEEDIPYTAAAATIAAQLTDIAVANTTGIVSEDVDLEITASPPTGDTNTPTVEESQAEATLPPTSTPLPTNTPLPSDTPPASDTPEPSPTTRPTNTPKPTEEQGESSPDLGEPDWQDTFNNATNWPIYSDEHVQMRITADNRLEMISLEADKWESWMLTWPVLENFYLEVIATQDECSGLDRYGLLARTTTDAKNGYLFGITCDGRYSFRIWDSETFTMIVPWTSSEAINTGNGETNSLGLLAEGNEFSLYINGEFMNKVQDETFSEGLIGLFIGGLSTDEFRVWFEEVSYWELPPTIE